VDFGSCKFLPLLAGYLSPGGKLVITRFSAEKFDIAQLLITLHYHLQKRFKGMACSVE
jgi:hypothetical protein